MGDVVLIKYVTNGEEVEVMENGDQTKEISDVESVEKNHVKEKTHTEESITTGEVNVQIEEDVATAEIKTEESTNDDFTLIPDKKAEGKDEEETNGSTVIIEEAKQELPPNVILYQFPRGENIPNLSPFCLKLETFMRMNSIPHESQYGYKMGKKGKLPWIDYKGERVADSNFIIKYLNDKFDVDMDKDFSSEQIALGRVARSMLEENTYWVIIFYRYVANFNDYKKFLSPPTGTGIGFNITLKMYQRKMRANLDAQGLGRHSGEELLEIGKADLKAVSDMLGDKEFLLGSEPSTFDCSVFSVCANILYSGFDTPLGTFIKENANNLCEFCDKIKSLYWTDWDDVVTPKIIEPSTKKGFYFKKKLQKKVKNSEHEMDERDVDAPAAADAPAVDAPAAADAPAVDVPAAADAPAVDVPAAADAPAVDATAAADAPAVDATAAADAPAVDAPAAVETPAVDAPAAVETPAVDAPAAVETPAVDAPAAVETPAVDAPAAVETPAVDAPAAAETAVVDATVTADTQTCNATVTADTQTCNATVTADTPAVDATVTADTPAVDAPATAETPATDVAATAATAAVEYQSAVDSTDINAPAVDTSSSTDAPAAEVTVTSAPPPANPAAIDS